MSRQLLLILLLVSCSTAERTVELNRLVDVLVSIASKGLNQNGRAEIPIRDVDEEFRRGWGLLSVGGSFKGTGGWVRDISSMRRTSNATLTVQRSGVTLEVGFGLGVLEAGFENYEAKFGVIAVSGEVKVAVANNSVSLEVLLNYDQPECTAEIRRVTVDNLEGIDVQLTGLWRLNGLYSRVVTWLANRSKRRITESVELQAFLALQEALEKYAICDELGESVRGIAFDSSREKHYGQTSAKILLYSMILWYFGIENCLKN